MLRHVPWFPPIVGPWADYWGHSRHVSPRRYKKPAHGRIFGDFFREPAQGRILEWALLRGLPVVLAGFFNAQLKKHQVSWLPCEVEALAIGASIRHFAPYIVQSNQPTQVLTDSRPCVLAYDKLQRGDFSTSSRVTTFLSIVSRYQVAIQHVSGATNLPSDYSSRHPIQCPDHSCQVCHFVNDLQDSVVRDITVQDVLDGSIKMPFTSRIAWLSTQQECQDLRRTHAYLSQGTRPTKKLTNIPDVKRYLRVTTIASDGVLVVCDCQPFQPVRERIVVPRSVLHSLEYMAPHESHESMPIFRTRPPDKYLSAPITIIFGRDYRSNPSDSETNIYIYMIYINECF